MAASKAAVFCCGITPPSTAGTASFGATLIFFVLLAVWNPGNGTPHGHKHRRNRPKPKPIWPPAGQEVQGCNPVGNASAGLPVSRAARVFLLQRDERKNLADMINYHRQGLSPDQIVVLDHRSDDALTRRVLARFSAAGGHVWRCERESLSTARTPNPTPTPNPNPNPNPNPSPSPSPKP